MVYLSSSSSSARTKTGKGTHTILTPEELEGLVQAMDDLQRDKHKNLKERYRLLISEDPQIFNDLFFVRFLRARAFDVEKTCKMLERYFTWREEMNIREIQSLDLTYIRETVRQHYPHGFHGLDKLGRPIYIERLGQSNIGRLLDALSQDQLVKYYIQRYEYLVHVIMPAASIKTAKVIEQHLSIVDLRGFSISQINTKLKSFMTTLSAMAQNYYPEILGKMVFINTPTYFSAFWTLISSLVDPKTLSKIKVISSKSESKKYVLGLVDADQIPEFLGGTHPSESWQMSNFGPWSDPEILETLRARNESIPKHLFEITNM